MNHIDIAYCIALLAFFSTLSISIVVFYFTTAVVITFIVFFVTWYYALKWLDYVWPPKKEEEF